jgi:hypothetical protein
MAGTCFGARKMMDQLGGVGSLVKADGRPQAQPDRQHHAVSHTRRPALPQRAGHGLAVATLLAARRRTAHTDHPETFFPAGQDLALWARYGLDVKAIGNVGCKVEWENAQNLGQASSMCRMKVPRAATSSPLTT